MRRIRSDKNTFDFLFESALEQVYVCAILQTKKTDRDGARERDVRNGESRERRERTDFGEGKQRKRKVK